MTLNPTDGTSDDRDDDRLLGRVLGGKFRLTSRVGAGASGAVYQADQTALGRTVAVKVLHPDMARDPRLVGRFHDEALAASRLNHPNTVSVIDYGQSDDGLLYIVMEFLRGVTLTALLEAEPVLDDARIIDILSQILMGLEEAHHAGVIHADLKCDNVMVERRRGGWDLVKVVDFGIARLLETPRQSDAQPTICGTPEYMAPEIISGQAPTVTSDLYAVGVVLYELLAGQTPFAGGSTIEILTRQLREDPPPPRARRPDRTINQALATIALRALAKNPLARYRSALEFRKALDSVAHGLRDGAPGNVHAGEADILSCASCGVASSSDFKFCPQCGYPLSGHVMQVLDDVTTAPLRGGHRVPGLDSTGARVPTLAAAPALIGGHDSRTETGEEPPAHSIWPLPLLGRDAQLALLRAFVRGPGTAVARLVGPGGSGRSRLIRELVETLDDGEPDLGEPGLGKNDSPRLAEAHRVGPDPSGLGAPFHPIRAMVASLLALSPTCGYDRLSAELARLGLTRRDLPGIVELFGHRGELWQLSPTVRRRELFASTIRVFKAATRRGRLLLIFENADRYDQPSRELLHQLCEATDDRTVRKDSERQRAPERPHDHHPLRVLITLAPEHAGAWSQATTRVDLPPLDDTDLDAMAGYLALTGVDGMPDAAELAANTDCQPGHIHHLVRFVVEGGGVERAPRSMADLIAERVKSLPYPSRVLCQAVAIFGVEAPRAIVVQALGKRLGAVDEALSVLKARGLIHDRQGGAIVSFSSQLVRDVVYDAIPAELRRELHTAAAAVLESATTDALVLGHHQYLAGNLAGAARNLERAGDDAVHQLDDSGATHLYHRAQNAVRTLMLADDDPERRAAFVALSAKLADALRLGNQASLARGIVDEARGYSHGSPLLEAQLWRATAHLSLSEDKLDAAIVAMGRGIGLLIQAGATQLLAEMYLDLSAMHLRNDDMARAIAELSEGLDLITMGEGHGATDGPEILWRLLLRLAQLHGEMGNGHEALALATSALAHARRVGSRIGSARAQAMLAAHYERAGDAERAEHHRDAAVDEMRRLGDRRGTAELLLGSGSPTRTLLRINPANLREARDLADEVGWSEGVQLAQEKITKNRSVTLS